MSNALNMSKDLKKCNNAYYPEVLRIHNENKHLTDCLKQMELFKTPSTVWKENWNSDKIDDNCKKILTKFTWAMVKTTHTSQNGTISKR